MRPKAKTCEFQAAVCMHVYVHMRAHYQDVYMKRNDGGRSYKAAHNAAFLSGGGEPHAIFRLPLVRGFSPN